MKKCPKCGNVMEDDYRFCSQCRYQFMPVQNIATNVASFAQPVSEEAKSSKFEQEVMPEAKEKETAKNNLSGGKDASIVISKHKAIWRIMSGEVCHHIDEKEFEQYDTMKGIIIEQGVVAVIVVDGSVVARLSGGSYDFVNVGEPVTPTHTPTGEVKKPGFINRITNFIKRIKLVRVIKDAILDPKSAKTERVIENEEDVIRKLMVGRNVAVYLILEREFPMMFGCVPNEEGKPSFFPMTIRARNVDAKACVSLAIRITDFDRFVVQYMTGCKSVLLQDLQKVVMPVLARNLREEMRNVAIDECGVPEVVIRSIETKLKAESEGFGGFSVVRIIDIDCKSESFERFRKLSEEMYCSEKELDYLRRTNEFKNILAKEENDQKIEEAKSILELNKALNDINKSQDEIDKDHILHEEELKSFARLILHRRTIADAQDELEILQALEGIERTRLLGKEEMDVLRKEIEKRRVSREDAFELARLEAMALHETRRMQLASELYSISHANEMQQLKDQIEVEDIATAHKQKHELQDALHTQEMTGAAIEIQAIKDRYMDQRWDTERDHARTLRKDKREEARQEAIDAIEIEERARMTDVNVHRATLEADWENTKAYQDMAMSAWERIHAVKNKEAEAEHMRAMEMRTKDDEMTRYTIDKNAELQKAAMQNSHEEKMVETAYKTRLVEIEASMTAEQIAARRLDAEGAKEAVSSRKELEAMEKYQQKHELEERERKIEERERKAEQAALYQQFIDMQKNQNAQNNETMMQMAKMMQQGMMGVATQQQMTQQQMYQQQQQYQQERINDLVVQKDEYRQENLHNQARIDANQQQSLNYATRTNVAEAQGPLGPQIIQNRPKKKCPTCGGLVDVDDKICHQCGEELN